MAEEKKVNLEPVERKFHESRVGRFLSNICQRVKNTFKRRHRNSIKIDTVRRPLPVPGATARSASLASNNSLPYVILSDVYGLREENLTLDLNSMIKKARKKAFVENMPLSQNSLKLFFRLTCFEKDFITINYLKQFSANYDPKYLLNKFIVNEKMFTRPDNALWIYDENNFGDGICFYQIKIRTSIKDLDEVILGEDLFIRALEVPNHQLEHTVEYDCEIRKLLTGRRTVLSSNIRYNPHIDPDQSSFADTENEEKDSEEEENTENLNEVDADADADDSENSSDKT